MQEKLIYLGLARTVYIRVYTPYIWWFFSQNYVYRIYMVLANPRYIPHADGISWGAPCLLCLQACLLYNAGSMSLNSPWQPTHSVWRPLQRSHGFAWLCWCMQMLRVSAWAHFWEWRGDHWHVQRGGREDSFHGLCQPCCLRYAVPYFLSSFSATQHAVLLLCCSFCPWPMHAS